MRKSIKILAIILSSIIAFSLIGCNTNTTDETPPDTTDDKIILSSLSEYDQGGFYDGITLSVDVHLKNDSYYMKIVATIDSSFLYASEGGSYNFCYSVTGVDSDDNESTVVKTTDLKQTDDIWLFCNTARKSPCQHVYARISDYVSLSGNDVNFETAFLLQQSKGTLAVEFNLYSGDRLFAHSVIIDYTKTDEEIQFKEINKLSDYCYKDESKNETDNTASMLAPWGIESESLRNGYYAQDMNAGKGNYSGWLHFADVGRYPDIFMALSVHSFAGYFDSSSPLTDIYIGYGVYNLVRYTSPITPGKATAYGDFIARHEKFADLVLVSREEDENGTVLREQSRTALSFSSTDKRNIGSAEPSEVIKIHERRGVVKEDDFIGECGTITFEIDVVDKEWWNALSTPEGTKIFGSIVMRYKKINGKIYIGKSLAEP